VDEGLEWMIRDYELRVHPQDDELDLAEMHIFASYSVGEKTQLRCECCGNGK
jgi:hypothetical protein